MLGRAGHQFYFGTMPPRDMEAAAGTLWTWQPGHHAAPKCNRTATNAVLSTVTGQES